MRRLVSVLLLAIWFASIGYSQAAAPSASRRTSTTRASTLAQPERKHSKFNWTAALGQTAIFLGIEHSLNLKNYLDIPHDHFFHRYAESVRAYHFDRWNDGNHLATNYVGHPFSGAIVGFIQIQNDPPGWLPMSAGEYWKSRLKATAWAAAYSLQWEIGPLSESSLGNYGIYPYRDSKGRLVNSTGLVDLFITPLGGLGWMAAEDWLDRRFLSSRQHPNVVLCVAVNPARTTANLIRFKRPCFRDTH